MEDFPFPFPLIKTETKKRTWSRLLFHSKAGHPPQPPFFPGGRCLCKKSHHHKFRGPSFRISPTGTKRGRLLSGALGVAERMLLAEDAAVPFEEVVAQDQAAFLAGEAVRVELLLPVRFQVRPFDAAVATRAQGSVVFVVMPPTVRIVVVDVEIRALERSLAGLARETLLVVAPRQLPVCRADGFAIDCFVATPAKAFARRRAFSRR